MKFRHFLMAAAMLISVPTFAQAPEKDAKSEEEGYKFEVIKELPVTSVKDQNRAGTCWCYSTLGFFEAELLRMGKPEYDFSEMYIVYKTYQDRADRHVRTHGDVSYAEGGSFGDVIYAIKHYGLVPDVEMSAGQMHGDSLTDFSEFSNVSGRFLEGVVKTKKLQLGTDENHTPLWKTAFDGILDAYIGKCPEKFTYNGKEYTPMEFAKSTGLNMDDYVNIASFAHQPWYEPFVIEVQDNWRWGKAYNLPVDEFMEVMNYAIDNGYPIAWGADVSESGWLRGKMAGVCVLPDLKNQAADKSGTDFAHWNGLSAADRQREAMSKPTPQRIVNDQDRLDAYNNYETTDDHGMVIYGKAKDQMGNIYFMVKNSWGDAGNYHGNWYASEAFVRYKTLNYVVHKDALPKAIRKKLGIK
ncbi:MAG: aminopeptidase [Bacteroidetes bacterium]|nr:aminopeptidase [Bacteroidota bacterium]